MKIINAMFAKGLGGIEQAFIDYGRALAMAEHEVICVIQPKAKISDKLEALQKEFPSQITIKKIPNFGWWDFSAKLCLECIARKEKAEAIIAHGNRPTSLFKYASDKNDVPLISVAHNYKVEPLLKAGYIFSITNDLKDFISGKGFDAKKISIIPNSISIPDRYKKVTFKKYRKPPVIGVIARFVKKKGVDVFIEACSALKATGVEFSAVIGGTGEEVSNLQSLRDERKLNDNVRFIGWVEDKEKFYDDINIFCLPSLHEPFGIVILEAMMRKKPIVSTRSEGPLEILEHEKDSLMVDVGHSGQLAMEIKRLIEDEQFAKQLAENSYKKLKQKYDIKQVSKLLNLAIEKVVKDYKKS